MDKQARYYSYMVKVSRAVLLGITSFLLLGCLEADTRDLQQFVDTTKREAPAQKLPPLPTLEPYKPFYYTAEGLKDPFELSKFVSDALDRQAPVTERDDNGVRPPEHIREELEKYALGALEMVGTFRDLDTEGLWALVKAPDGIVHRVKPGNYVGENFGEILGITEGRIDILEIVRDGDTGGWKERDTFLSLPQ